jgi:C1A family cysteine protease
MRTSSFLLLGGFLALAASFPLDDSLGAFQSYREMYNRTYDDAEVPKRLAAFKASVLEINELNKIEGEEIFGLTKFSDLTKDEFKARYLTGFKPTDAIDRENAPLVDDVDFNNVNATSLDWRTKGKVTPVKDQQQCGSCWAFSATEAIESAWLMAGNSQQILSPQQIVSCDKKDLGCNGGDTPTAYKYVQQAGGMVTAKKYPYTSGKGKNGRCLRNKLNPKVVKIKGFAYATPPKSKGKRKPNEKTMAATMAAKGPVSVCVDAGVWQNYKRGVLTRTCKQQLDHCVQAVGYSQSGNKPYWIVRNSWNTDWGIKGYVYVGMGGDYCGIANEATIVQV